MHSAVLRLLCRVLPPAARTDTQAKPSVSSLAAMLLVLPAISATAAPALSSRAQRRAVRAAGHNHHEVSTAVGQEFYVHDDAVAQTFQFDATSRVKVQVTEAMLEKAAARAKRDFIYEHTLSELAIELVKLQEHVKAKGLKVCVLFEGRDAAGKGGVISRVASAMSPRICRIAALAAPTEREKSQWYFQRYVPHLPSAGEIVLFDRSWYNRAGVEHVMGFCTPEQYESFMHDVPHFERMLVESGIVLIKYWLDVSDAEQEFRFTGRLQHSWKRWKLSPMDLFARSKWTDYARARDAMLARTDSKHAPWVVVPSDDKQASRLNCITDLLSRIPYEPQPPMSMDLPARDSASAHPETYEHPPEAAWRYVRPVYDNKALSVPGHPLDSHSEHHDHHNHIFSGHAGDA